MIELPDYAPTVVEIGKFPLYQRCAVAEDPSPCLDVFKKYDDVFNIVLYE